MDKVSYALGLGIGRQLSDMGAQELNIDDFAQAIKDVIAGRRPLVDNSRLCRISSKSRNKSSAQPQPRSTRCRRLKARNTWPRMPRKKVS